MPRRRRNALPPLALLALAIVALALAACGSEEHSKEVVEGQPVTLGELKYNVIFSRFLNPNDNEDSAYLVGQPEAPADAAYFGVFVEVQNEVDEPQRLPRSLTIVDAEGDEYEAQESESLYALPFGGEVESEEQIPVLDSTAEQGPIEGALVLFLLPDLVSENRPLVMEIPGSEGPAEVTLDL
jgi:hypothetical protein